jgi:hypothetical protein
LSAITWLSSTDCPLVCWKPLRMAWSSSARERLAATTSSFCIA